MSLELIVMYIVVGLIAGVLAGLLGVGGGVVIVPMLVFCFVKQGIQPDQIMHLALGTSLASIIFTSISSFMSHHRRGAVEWRIVKQIVPGILIGTFAGTFIAAQLSTNFLKAFFCVFLYAVATQMLLNKKPTSTRELPGSTGMFGVGSTIGVVSALVGIGGGSLSVPFMIWCNVPAHRAIGTSAAIGFPIAVAGAAGYIINNLQASGLPAYSFGYVYLPALVAIVCFSVLTAPLGARLAHALPVDKLKKIFAIFLYAVATRMVWSLIA
ncbi:sulfite exporter TauE/SafE family protein [Desulfobulbus oligotrophicus]|uniref:Probable membrane transporter protein n=1 Tax=Desulfobulbus oligotrophicus TaxID=1909699 RepID=A0A7T5VED4_9BACT|nr:sulfite exporter TauE/SafE family protein [Desulfobulbus oligotrophicus]QQG66241.1 sulfite exporter TauE/SafE family protein [Desulfobulbus oligotrophicus]